MLRLRNIAVLAASALALGAGASPQKAPQASAGALLAKGQKALDAGQGAEALRQGAALVAAYPKGWEGHRLVARASLLLDRPDGAEAAFRQALRLAPASARPSLGAELRGAVSLRQALAEAARARALKASGDDAGAARAQEAAYGVLPAREAYGLAAAELFETAGLLDDARRVLESVRARHPSAAVQRRLDLVQTRSETVRKQAADERAQREDDARKAAAERAAEKERRRIEAEREAERRAEEERQKAEKARLDREETERLNEVLSGLKRDVSEAEEEIRQGDARADDAQRAVRKIDGELDDARDDRNRAKREKEKWEDKLKDAKSDMERDVIRGELRSAASAYDDAKEKYGRVDRRMDEAKSRLSQAQQDADAARRRLEQARQGVRDTENALARIASGG